LAALLEGDSATAREALTLAFDYDQSLGSSTEELARMIAQYALEYDAREKGSITPSAGEYLARVRIMIPSGCSRVDALRIASAQYWRAKAHQAHERCAGIEVRRNLFRALRYGVKEQINRGTVSILLQSVVGERAWRRFRAFSQYTAR
jgi:hypothetical protein